MKVKLLSVATIVALFFASCGGVDKGLVDKITKFEGDWTSMVTHVNGVSDTMILTAEETTKACEEACSQECTDKKMITHMDTMKQVCNNAKEGMTSTITNITDFKIKLKTATDEFAAWKEKVMKGEIKAEEAGKALDEYRAKLTDAQDQLLAFQTNFDASAKECTSSCTATKECCEKK
ncbi:MAG: hypothetical protein NTW54_03155 [Bacteroidetes bacterium]|nr:hypothetical protein [Bacteroidota bacterium]